MSEDRSDEHPAFAVKAFRCEAGTEYWIEVAEDDDYPEREEATKASWAIVDRLRAEGRKAAAAELRKSAKGTLALAEACDDDEIAHQLRDRAESIGVAADIIDPRGDDGVG